MHDRQSEIENRVRRVLRERLTPAVHTPVAGLTIEAWHVEGGGGEPVDPPIALGLQGNSKPAYEPFGVGDPWGPPWGTSWLHVTGTLPEDVQPEDAEIVVNLGWQYGGAGFQAEGLVYRPDGSVIKGINPFNEWLKLESREIDFYIEAAANPHVADWKATELGDKLTAPTEPIYKLIRADINVFHENVWELVADIDVLAQLAKGLPVGEPRKWEILLALDHALDLVDLADIPGSAQAARESLKPVFAKPANASAHQLTATGHAHIDSAWLWPVRETVRKVARTTANQVNLLETYPDHVYAMSSAQQYEWIKERRPEVYEKVQAAVAEGRFIPVGGMWVESDTNMVGSEAMARQLIFGQNFFQSEFGVLCDEVWLPDSFGYSGALPQIVKLAGAQYFLTQKISWNTVNKFPHHTFMWEGIDGTRVFTHFPPVDTYNADLSGRELDHAVTNFRDKGASSHSLAPFGWGDGGGGPTREMLQRARRTKDLEGSAKVTIRSPKEFFDDAAAEYHSPAVWKGELYLEIHRGTYTSQAKTKQGNRRSEHLLREAEQWSTMAAIHAGLAYPYEELARIWKLVLLQQFHDILPGSAIAWVHREARENYQQIFADLTKIIDAAQQALVGKFGTGEGETIFNGAPVSRAGLVALSAAPADSRVISDPVSLAESDGGYLISNSKVSITIDDHGLITSAVDKATGRETLPAGKTANLLQLHADFPNAWDAWDIDEFYKHTVTDLTEIEGLKAEQLPDGSVEVRLRRTFNNSSVDQVLTVRPDESGVEISNDIDWHEQEKLLKLAFPIDVHADSASYEIQFGHLQRPTHENTSWDTARFEVCAHRWVQVGETGFGAAVANDSTYGHDVSRHPHPDGGSYSVVRLSLLRGPRYPDPRTDQDRHLVKARFEVGADVAQAINAGYQLNLPERRQSGAAQVPAIARVDGPVIIESIKLAEDQSGDVIVRLYEPFGGRGRAKITPGFGYGSVSEVDLLERPIEQVDVKPALVEAGAESAEVAVRPFQIVSLRFSGVKA
ncbi:alpha-mannosidase [Microlunatus elymi]|uniref:Alpha-mannosidase n=1 Tax=Microlunatus elymi TaxID=2596828 RepID=A0A516Q034_9ACTN|nr:glycoside hydrolase family 38 C-terminal domain-containing protein [Microlunatus elymi]QDP96581.1 alpha-mannosidase [Microlunatus elymi]